MRSCVPTRTVVGIWIAAAGQKARGLVVTRAANGSHRELDRPQHVWTRHRVGDEARRACGREPFCSEPVKLLDAARHCRRQGVALVGAVAERGRSEKQRGNPLRPQHGEPGCD